MPLLNVSLPQVSFDNTPYEYSCIHKMVECYKWLFQVDEAEEKKEEVCVCVCVCTALVLA